jgi:hypothetical protein
MKRISGIDARRPMVGGIPGWGAVPGLLIPGQEHAFGIFEDFLHVSELNVPAGITHMVPGWEGEIQNAGTLQTADVRGGVVLMQAPGADNDAVQITLGSLDGGAFWPEAGKDIWVEFRVKLSPADDINFAVGLQDPSTTIYLDDDGAGLTVNNHICFYGLDEDDAAAVDIMFVGDKAGAADANDTGYDLADLTWMYLGFYVNGVTSVDCYYNRVKIASAALATANIPITGLMPFLCLKAGQGEAQALYADWCMAVQQR